MDAIGVTYGPGLVGALLVGIAAAKALAFTLGKPLIGVNHIDGHVCANYISHKQLEPPFVCLIASGGHSHIVNIVDYRKQIVLGRTRDDAAGEAFDKIARVLGLGYPGGPLVEKMAEQGDEQAFNFKSKFKDSTKILAFSGLKTAYNVVNQYRQK